MVEWPSPRRLGCRRRLWLLRLATELDAAHALSDAGDISGPGLPGDDRSRIALAGSLVAAVCTLLLQLRLLGLAAHSLPGTVGLGVLVSRGYGLLRVLLRIASIGGRLLLDGRDAVLLSASLPLATDGGIGPRADLKGLGGISSLLLLARSGGGNSILLGDVGLGRVLKLLLRLLARELAVPVVGRSRHGWKRRRNRRDRTQGTRYLEATKAGRRRALQRVQALSGDRVGAGFGRPRSWVEEKPLALSYPSWGWTRMRLRLRLRTEMRCAAQLGFGLVERLAEQGSSVVGPAVCPLPSRVTACRVGPGRGTSRPTQIYYLLATHG